MKAVKENSSYRILTEISSVTRSRRTWSNELTSVNGGLGFMGSLHPRRCDMGLSFVFKHLHRLAVSRHRAERDVRSSPRVSSSLSFHLPIPPELLTPPPSPPSISPRPPPPPPSPNFSPQHCGAGFHGDGRARAAS